MSSKFANSKCSTDKKDLSKKNEYPLKQVKLEKIENQFETNQENIFQNDKIFNKFFVKKERQLNQSEIYRFQNKKN